MPDRDPIDVMFDSKLDCETRILIVDDEDAILRALKRELREEPYQIITMNDPFAALDAVRQNRFSLIMSDYRMPGMTGIELLEQVKQISPETVCIMLTGNTDLKSAVEATNMGGIHGFLTKPWEKEQLLERIREGLGLHRLNLTDDVVQ